MAHASPLADTTNRCERCNALFLVSCVMLNSGTWSIIFCVYISPRYRVKSKNFLWVFWLLQLQMRPWHREKRSFPSFVDKTSPSVSCFQLIVRHEFPKDRVHSEGSDLISNGSLHTHTHFDTTEERISWLIQQPPHCILSKRSSQCLAQWERWRCCVAEKCKSWRNSHM